MCACVFVRALPGLIQSLTDRKLGTHVSLKQEFLEYSTERSGAYIFRLGRRHRALCAVLMSRLACRPSEKARAMTHNRQLTVSRQSRRLGTAHQSVVSLQIRISSGPVISTFSLRYNEFDIMGTQRS